MMDLDFNQYIDLFVEETKEHLQIMNEALLELEKDITNRSLIDEIFRVAHTLKGMAGTMGFNNISNLTHEMENVLQEIRNNTIKLNEDIIDIIFECFDVLEYSVNFIAVNGEEGEDNHEDLINRLRSITKKEQVQLTVNDGIIPNNKEETSLNQYAINAMKEAEKKGFSSYKITINLNPKCVLKSARAFIIFNTLESMGDIIYSNPPVEDIEDENFDLSFVVILISKVDGYKLKEALEGIAEVEKVDITLIEDVKKAIGKEGTSTKMNVQHKSSPSNMKDNKTNIVNREKKIGKTVRVDIDRLDNLMNLVSELIIIKTRMDDLSESSNRENMVEAIEYLERITTSLHDAVMKVRMVPIERVFNRFPRMVRDLSKELNKQINLQMLGEETEVDRTVIDEIGDPLIHIIRNSIDHGIEMPEERTRLGKPEEGKLILKAYPDGNNVVIEVIDDGRGIDPVKVKDKAIQKEIITEQEGDMLSEDEIVALLFTPGFSTSDKVSDLSGRGVGLDVVKSKIESINGSVEIETNINIGTKFIIRIPLTLAIIQALLVRLGNEIYAIPLSSITEITDIKKEDIRDIQGQEIMLYRGKTIPVVKLNKLLNIDFNEDVDEYVVVVVRKGEKQAGLLVDSLIGQQEIVIKPLGKYLSKIKYLSGATILGNGSISLILDVNSLI